MKLKLKYIHRFCSLKENNELNIWLKNINPNIILNIIDNEYDNHKLCFIE